MTDEAIRAHLAAVQRQRSAFMRFWNKHIAPTLKTRDRVEQAARMIQEWNSWRKLQAN